MGVYNAELFTNLGLCCFFAQQYDMTLSCFQRALALASDENIADVWYNIGHAALVRSLLLFVPHVSQFKKVLFVWSFLKSSTVLRDRRVDHGAEENWDWRIKWNSTAVD